MTIPNKLTKLAASISALETFKAGRLDEVTPSMQVYVPTSVSVARTSPGAYGMQFATGKLDTDALAMLIAPTGATVPSAVANADGLAQFFRDPTVAQRVFERLFTRKSATISKNQVILTLWDVQTAIAKAAENSTVKLDGPLLTVVAEVILFLLASVRFVQPSHGLNYRDVRTSRYPTRDEYLLEAIRADIRDHLAKADLRLSISTTKFTPALVQEQMTEVLARLGRALVSVSWSYKKVTDAMYAVRTSLLIPSNDADRLPDEIMSSAVLQELRSNFTFMRASLTGLPLNPSTTPWDYASSLAHTAQMLAMSPRYETVSIAQAAAIYHVSHLEDGRRNATAALISPKVAFDHKVIIGQVSTLANSVVPATEVVRLGDMEDVIGRLTAEAVTSNTTDGLHGAMVNMLSQLTIDETEADATSRLFAVNVIDELDYVMLALREASTIYIDPKEAEDTLDIVYEVTLDRKRIFADSLPIDDVIITKHPQTAIIAGKDRAATLAFDTRAQLIPVEMYDGYFLGDQSGHFQPLAGSYKFKVAVGDTRQHIDLNPVEILGLQPRALVNQVDPFLDRILYSNFLLAVLKVGDVVAKDEYGDSANRLSASATLQVQRMACHVVNSLLARVYGTTIGRQIVSKLTRIVTAGASAADRQQLYKTLSREEYASQLRIKGSLMMLATSNWVDTDTMREVLSAFDRCEFYMFQRSALPIENDQKMA